MPKLIVNTKGMSYENWLATRDKGIGGSDAASVAGVNPYKNPVVTYMEKVGLYKQPPAGEAAYWGNQLEDIVRKEFVRRIDKERDEQGRERLRVQQRHAIFAHDEHDFMRANVDGLIFCPELGKGIFEAKTANQFLSDEWDGDDVPNQYYIQVQHYIAVMDVDFAYIAVLIGGQKYKHYFIERDDETIKYLIDLERNFWFNNVLAKIPPQLDGADSETEMYKLLYPESIPQMEDQPPINLPNICIEYVEQVDAIKKLRDELKQEQQRFENEIKAIMATTEIAFAGNHKITWKTAKNGVRSFKLLLDAESHKNKFYDARRKDIEKQRKAIEKEIKAAEKERKALDKLQTKARKDADKAAKDAFKKAEKELKAIKKEVAAAEDLDEQQIFVDQLYKQVELKKQEMEGVE